MRWLAWLVALLRLPLAVVRISPLRLQPGDTIVLHVDQKRPTSQQVDILKGMAERVWPGHKVLILPADITLSVMRPGGVSPNRSVEPPAFSKMKGEAYARSPTP